MALINHMLLASFWPFELLITVKTQLSELNSLGNISEKPFEIDQTLDVQDVEVVLITHMID
jgi:hypothetical protein